jgi:hypothetical protein
MPFLTSFGGLENCEARGFFTFSRLSPRILPVVAGIQPGCHIPTSVQLASPEFCTPQHQSNPPLQFNHEFSRLGVQLSLLPCSTVSQQFPSMPLCAPVTAQKRNQKSLTSRRASPSKHSLHHKIQNPISFFLFPLNTILIFLCGSLPLTLARPCPQCKCSHHTDHTFLV